MKRDWFEIAVDVFTVIALLAGVGVVLILRWVGPI